MTDKSMSRARYVVGRQPSENRWAFYSKLNTVVNTVGGLGRINGSLLIPVGY